MTDEIICGLLSSPIKITGHDVAVKGFGSC